MCEDIGASRSTSEGDTRNTVDSRGYTVWLQAVHPVHDKEPEDTWLRDGTQERLQELLDEAAKKRDESPKKIDVRWTDNVAGESPKKNEIVIYFVKSYAKGLIKAYITERERRGDLNPALQQADEAIMASQSEEGGEGGLTLLETKEEGEWSLAEVYVEKCWESSTPDPEASNYEDLVKRQARLLGNTAFHEAMHDKVDPTKGDSWDLHTQGGGGLADPTFKGETDHTSANIKLMADAVGKNRAQYIKGQTKPPELKKAAPKEKAKSTEYDDVDLSTDW